MALVASSVCLVRGDPRDYPGVEVGDPTLCEIDDDAGVGGLLASRCGRAADGAADEAVGAGYTTTPGRNLSVVSTAPAD